MNLKQRSLMKERRFVLEYMIRFCCFAKLTEFGSLTKPDRFSGIKDVLLQHVIENDVFFTGFAEFAISAETCCLPTFYLDEFQ